MAGFHASVVERNLEKAADTYRAFLAVHPDTAAAHNNLGRIYMQMRRFDEAIGELQEAIRLDPDLFLAYFSPNSIYLYEIGDLDAAIATAKRQLARNDRSARAYGQLGAAYAGKNDLRQAEIAFRKSLELDPPPPRRTRRVADSSWPHGRGARDTRARRRIRIPQYRLDANQFGSACAPQRRAPRSHVVTLRPRR